MMAHLHQVCICDSLYILGICGHIELDTSSMIVHRNEADVVPFRFAPHGQNGK